MLIVMQISRIWFRRISFDQEVMLADPRFISLLLAGELDITEVTDNHPNSKPSERQTKSGYFVSTDAQWITVCPDSLD